eukprot:3060943-Prymnesium_polylepis.1
MGVVSQTGSLQPGMVAAIIVESPSYAITLPVDETVFRLKEPTSKQHKRCTSGAARTSAPRERAASSGCGPARRREVHRAQQRGYGPAQTPALPKEVKCLVPGIVIVTKKSLRLRGSRLPRVVDRRRPKPLAKLFDAVVHLDDALA